MRYVAYILIFACLIRLVTNMIWAYFDSPPIYYIGQALFECIILGVLVSLTENWLKTSMVFFFGLSIYALVKEFIDPTKYDPAEYFGLFVGLSFIIIQRLWLRRTWKKK